MHEFAHEGNEIVPVLVQVACGCKKFGAASTTCSGKWYAPHQPTQRAVVVQNLNGVRPHLFAWPCMSATLNPKSDAWTVRLFKCGQ